MIFLECQNADLGLTPDSKDRESSWADQNSDEF